MLEIREQQELNLENLFSYRGRAKQTELETIVRAMDDSIRRADAKRAGNPITATYGVEGDSVDIEILIPVDRVIESTDRFTFKERVRIVNAVVASHKGHPVGLQATCDRLNQYIVEQGLQPITVGYNVTKHTDLLNPENTQVDVYVGITPNIL